MKARDSRKLRIGNWGHKPTCIALISIEDNRIFSSSTFALQLIHRENILQQMQVYVSDIDCTPRESIFVLMIST